MATLKNKWLRTISFTVIMLGLFFTVKALDNKDEEKVEKSKTETKLDAVWFIFNSPLNPGDSGYEAALQNEDNYSPTHSSTPPTVCDDGTQKVCAVKANPSSADPDQPDPDELESLLPEMTSPTPDQNIIRLKPLD